MTRSTLPTIVTQLNGGLGNQMFQYAVGRALAIRHRCPLKLDTSLVSKDSLRTFALGHFSIKASELSSVESRALGLATSAATGVPEFLKKFLRRTVMPVVQERHYSFDPTVLDTPGSCYLQGYWQSPKYFTDIETVIRKEFTVKDPLAGQNRDLANRIRACTAVSLHVRRGDYVDNAQTNRYHGVCGAEYYEAAERYLLGHSESMELFVFSDDPDWAEENLRFRSPVTVLRHNGPERDYEDLRLMTMCRHHIIANSTFSWWGAWLCSSVDKIVVAPNNWFREAGHNTADLIPEAWARI